MRLLRLSVIQFLEREGMPGRRVLTALTAITALNLKAHYWRALVSTATHSVANSEPKVDNERLLGLFGMIFGVLGTFGVGLFWSMGMNILRTNEGGIVAELQLKGLWNTLFWAYPFVAIGAVVLALGAFAIGRVKEAAGISFLPVVGVVLYYFALVNLR